MHHERCLVCSCHYKSTVSNAEYLSSVLLSQVVPVFTLSCESHRANKLQDMPDLFVRRTNAWYHHIQWKYHQSVHGLPLSPWMTVKKTVSSALVAVHLCCTRLVTKSRFSNHPQSHHGSQKAAWTFRSKSLDVHRNRFITNTFIFLKGDHTGPNSSPSVRKFPFSSTLNTRAARFHQRKI